MQSLLLAGGKSSRMGIDKAMIEVDGHSMISRVVKALTLAGLEPIRIAVANPEDIEKYGSVVGPDADVDGFWMPELTLVRLMLLRRRF